MPCNHPKRSCVDLAGAVWCRDCGSLKRDYVWELSGIERAQCAAGWVWENFEPTTDVVKAVASLKVIPSGTVDLLALPHILRDARLVLTVDRRYVYVDDLLVNMLDELAFIDPMIVLPGMLVKAEIRGEGAWELRWKVRRLTTEQSLLALQRYYR